MLHSLVDSAHGWKVNYWYENNRHCFAVNF